MRAPREIIESLRIERGFISLSALARAAGIPQPTLTRYLAGSSKTMEVASFQALAKVLGVTLSELLGEVPISNARQARELVKIMGMLAEPEQEALLAAAKAMEAVARRQ